MSSDTQVVGRALRLCWPNLPMLLCGSVLVATAWAVPRLVAAWAEPWSWVWLGLVVVPLQSGLVDAGGTLLSGEHVGVHALLRRLPGTVLRAWRTCAPLTCGGLLMTAAASVWTHTSQWWALLSWGVSLAVTAALALVGVVALPYLLRADVRWIEGWRVGGYVAWRNPVIVLGIASAAGLAVWASAHLSFALLILVPAPLALVWAGGASYAFQHARAVLETPPPRTV